MTGFVTVAYTAYPDVYTGSEMTMCQTFTLRSINNVGDLGSIPGLGRSPGGGHGSPLQYSCLENPQGQRSLWAAVYGVTQSQTQLKQLSSSGSIASLVTQMVKSLLAMWETWVRSLGWEDPLEKGMATQSSILAWRIPQTGEPGRLQSTGSQRVGHD